MHRTWIWANLRRCWGTGRPGVQQFMGLQRQTQLGDWIATTKGLRIRRTGQTSVLLFIHSIHAYWVTHMYLELSYWLKCTLPHYSNSSNSHTLLPAWEQWLTLSPLSECPKTTGSRNWHREGNTKLDTLQPGKEPHLGPPSSGGASHLAVWPQVRHFTSLNLSSHLQNGVNTVNSSEGYLEIKPLKYMLCSIESLLSKSDAFLFGPSLPSHSLSFPLAISLSLGDIPFSSRGSLLCLQETGKSRQLILCTISPVWWGLDEI